MVDQVTELHVPPRDPVAIAAAAEQILDHPQQSATLGPGERRRVRTLYSGDRVTGETTRVYAQIVQRSVPQSDRTPLSEVH